MNTTIIQVDNLKCGGCANSIEQSLLKVDGVKLIKVNVEDSIVEIVYEGHNRRMDYIKALTKMGYPEAGTSNLIQKGKSYISCAIGRIT